MLKRAVSEHFKCEIWHIHSKIIYLAPYLCEKSVKIKLWKILFQKCILANSITCYSRIDTDPSESRSYSGSDCILLICEEEVQDAVRCPRPPNWEEDP